MTCNGQLAMDHSDWSLGTLAGRAGLSATHLGPALPGPGPGASVTSGLRLCTVFRCDSAAKRPAVVGRRRATTSESLAVPSSWQWARPDLSSAGGVCGWGSVFKLKLVRPTALGGFSSSSTGPRRRGGPGRDPDVNTDFILDCLTLSKFILIVELCVEG